jgi:RNA polymerase sigma factor (TIGR02999 family)
MSAEARPFTSLLLDWRGGNRAALDDLLPLVYDELRRVAQARLRNEAPGHTIQPTALVHEVYVRLADLDRLSLTDRAHFFAVAARLMRQILVDHARRKRADKRGGGDTLIALDDAPVAAAPRAVDLLDLDRALDELTALDERLAQVVELKFFVGLTIQEAADVLRVSHATLEREWATAKAWLYRRLARGTAAAQR